MRKLVSLSVLAVLLSVLAGTVFAGKVPVCEEIKGDPAYKGLYGLCVAYWTVDNENARDKILENFVKKAGPGGPPMPGLEPEEVTCPCLDAVAVINNRDWGTPVICTNDSGGNDNGIFVDPLDNFTTMFSTYSDGVSSSCGISQSPNTSFIIVTTLQEYDVCLTELLTRCAP